MRLLPCAFLVACAGMGNPYHASVAIAEATCERAVACAGSWTREDATFDEVWGADLAGCVERLGPDPADQERWKQADKNGTVLASAEQGRACREALAEATCEALWEAIPETCVDAVTGTLNAGEACDLDAACRSGWCGDRGVCEGGG